MAKQATAEVLPDGKYRVTHADGTEEEMTEGQFKAQYELQDEDPKVKGEDKSEDQSSGGETGGTEKATDDPRVAPADQAITASDGSRIGTVSGDEDPQTLSKANRPETHNRDDGWWGGDEDVADEYSQAVEAELKEVEEGVKRVRAELKSVAKAKPEDRDFGAVRSAMHDLVHGKSLLRTAHVATVRHDGPERLRPAPTAETNVSSGPGEELNPENIETQYGKRAFGR